MKLTSYLILMATAALLVGTIPSRLLADQTMPTPAQPTQAVRIPAATPRQAPEDKQDTVDGLRAVSGVKCAKRADMVNALGQLYHEQQQSTGLVSDKAAVELFVSDTGNWTLLATGTNGVSCMMAAGDGWDTRTLASLPSS